MTANPGALVVPRSTEYDTWDYVMQQCDLAAAQLPKERSDRRQPDGRHWL